MKTGEDFFTVLKKNNTTVWVVGFVAILSILGSLFFAFTVYKDSTNNIYSINEKGELIPLKKLEIQNAELIQAKANLELFVDQYYNLDAFSMKRKRERVLWLVGDQPTIIIKDRANKGYFDEFLSIAGLTQNAEILQQTLKITKEVPYTAEFVVRIQRVNGGVSEFYNSTIKLKMERVNRNFPYNPYGLLITQFSESLQKVDVKSEPAVEEIKASEEETNQNPKENGK
ncbi:hypothetical protein EG349_19915 (plasmid) [Chryseobacterium shandongense]|jgi:hypothetical protein|uniref:Conjugal transfer protein TraK n=2 Tax=Chryseobacterium TaxID=59732 RepID=A0AAD0YH86_9FLAO|nr:MULTISPECIES: hypothetical protein [Chryseobacterium]AZA89095.1 hypothetical protein EG349_19915 [Chryseobacterium shandongense]AZA98056.1 hypothetical protein EG353_20945 [Chryseobacterium shandongense]SHF34600.1 hypothetical protein SAMN05444408_11567 [Chryseobacterium takakiae]